MYLRDWTASYLGKTRCAGEKKIKQAQTWWSYLGKAICKKKNKPERGGYNV
jgi:hypothetical protein